MSRGGCKYTNPFLLSSLSLSLSSGLFTTSLRTLQRKPKKTPSHTGKRERGGEITCRACSHLGAMGQSHPQCRRYRLDPWGWENPRRRKGEPTPDSSCLRNQQTRSPEPQSEGKELDSITNMKKRGLCGNGQLMLRFLFP